MVCGLYSMHLPEQEQAAPCPESSPTPSPVLLPQAEMVCELYSMHLAEQKQSALCAANRRERAMYEARAHEITQSIEQVRGQETTWGP